MHGRNIPSGKDQHHWTPLPENGSPDKYAATISGFFRAVLRCHTGHPSGYTIPLTTVQAEEADRLLWSLRLSSEEYKVENTLDLLHQFSVSLLIRQPEPEGSLFEVEGDGDCSSWSCSVQCYLAVQGIRDDGNFIPPHVLTPQLAKFKYFCRNCALVQAEQTRGLTPGGIIE